MSKYYDTIECCRICGSNKIKEVLNLGNSLYKADKNKPDPVPLRLLFCKHCNTAQLGEDVNPEYLFGKYLWVTGTSDTAKQYSYDFSEKVLSKIINRKKSPYVVEIASNDGTFLRRFIEKDCKVLGIDPAKNIAEFATNNGIPTQSDFFTTDVAEKLVKKDGTADIVFARNVIPHVKEIHSVIKGMSILVGENGIGVIEVHNAELILKELHYDYIYHEHLFYYTLNTISKLIERHGMHVFDVSLSPISGGSWVIYFSNSKKDKTDSLIKYEAQQLEDNIDFYDKWVEFAKQVKTHSNKLKDLVVIDNKKIPAYGASARSSTLLNYCGLTNDHISVIIDKNPLKKGLMTAGSNIPIVSFEDGLEEVKKSEKILLLAWNFQDEIVKELRDSGFCGKFIIPLPGNPYIL